MKHGSALLAAATFLLCAAGLLHLSRGNFTAEKTRAVGQWVLTQQLGNIAALKTAPPSGVVAENAASLAEDSGGLDAASSDEDSAEPVPVETVEEAWDEEARTTDRTETEPTEIKVEGDVSLELRNETSYAIDFTQLPALPENLTLQTSDPVVLIVHTHGSESYEDGTDVYRSEDETKSVIAVGEAIAEALRDRGYGVIHDKTLCDYPEYTGAYNRSRTVIQDNLEQYPSIVLVLDIHRDAVENSDGTQMRLAATIGDTDMARLMLVVGSDEGGLSNPDWRENLSLAAVLQARLDSEFSGLTRPLNLRSERFNQDLAPLNLLVEVGASGNTLGEACQSGTCFASALADIFDEYSGKSS